MLAVFQARGHIPTERQIWIAAARLEETRGDPRNVDVLIDKALVSLRAALVEINRKQWLEDAIEAERAGCPTTGQAIIKNVMDIGVEVEDREHTWMEDAAWFVTEKAYECARAVYAFTLNTFPNEKDIWTTVAIFEKEHGAFGRPEHYTAFLEKAIESCPGAEDLWLMYSKSRWLQGDVDGARKILARAFEHNPNSEGIWMAAVKLESESEEFDRARRLLAKARSSAPSPKFWMKSARLEWCLNELESAKALLVEGIKRYPDFDRFYVMWGQIGIQQQQFEQARKVFKEGTRKCPHSIDL